MSKPSRRQNRRGRALRGVANIARAHPHRHPDWSTIDPRLEPDGDIGVQPGWYLDDGDQAEAQQGTHDALIRLMGAARRGPVRWAFFHGYDAAKPILDSLVDSNTSQHDLDTIRRIRALFREHGGHLVIAYARGDRTAAP